MRLVGLTLCVAMSACTTAATSTAVGPIEPQVVDGHECAVCGMTVREQPSPRGQVLHRDGTHLHFCSVGDLRAHLEAPNAHGAAVGVWVEALPDTLDVTALDTAPQSYVLADSASYVVGFERPQVMGRPVLSFESAGSAKKAAEKVGGKVVDWAALTSTPSHRVPGE